MESVRGRVEIRYRPAIDVEEARELLDVQELLVVLEQEDGPVRLAEVGRKRLPRDGDGGEQSPNWGHVRRVVEDADELDDVLGEWSYETATQGERHQSATVVAAVGRWSLERAGSSTYLQLDLEPQSENDLLLEQLGVAPTLRFAMNVKNPRARGDAGLDEEDRAEYPQALQRIFDGNRWAAADPVELLDHVGAEFVLVPAPARRRE